MAKKRKAPTPETETPETRVLELLVDPYQGMAAFATSIKPPDGFVFHSLERKGVKAIITFIRKPCNS